MTFYTVFKVSKLCSCRFPSFAHCHAARYRAYCPLLYRQSLAVSTAYLCRAATSDTDSSEVTKTRTVRWLPRSRKKKVIFKSSPLVNDPPASVLVDVLPSRECVGTDLQNTPLNTARTEVDEKLKELEEIASIQIPDIQLAVELENENTEEEPAEKTEVRLSNYPDRTHQLFGSPDPTVPASATPCHGCAAVLHCRDPGIPGYIPSQIFLAAKPSQLKEILCQRCHMLKEFNLSIDVSVEPMEFRAIAAEIKKKSPALLLIMIDLTDLPHSFYTGFSELVNQQCPAYIIGNKVDLLPRDDLGYLDRIKESVVKLCEERGIAAQHVALVSAKTGYGIEKLISRLLRDWKLKGQVFILGSTNAGKSTLFNALLSSDFCSIAARDILKRATASIWPGTTLNLLKFPILNPRPTDLHRRVARLREQKSLIQEEKQLRRQQFKETRSLKYATLMGHIGQTSRTPHEMALDDFIARRYASGFVAPSYTFETDVTDDGANVAELKESVSREAVLSQVRVPRYDDRRYKFWCYDTPGLINPDQIINMLNTDELMVLLVNELIMPRSFYVKPTQVMYVSGLGRIDYLQGDTPLYFTVFAAPEIPVHVVNCDECDEFYRTNVGSAVLGIPLGDEKRLDMIPSLVGRHVELEGIGWKECAIDVVLSSIGWVSITAGQGKQVSLCAYTPGGLGCSVRSPALLKHAIKLRGKRIRGTAAYRTRDLKLCAED